MEDVLPERNHAVKFVAVYDDRTNPHAVLNNVDSRAIILIMRTRPISHGRLPRYSGTWLVKLVSTNV